MCVKTLTKMCSIWKEEEQFRRMMVERAFEMIFAIPMDSEFALFDSDASEVRRCSRTKERKDLLVCWLLLRSLVALFVFL